MTRCTQTGVALLLQKCDGFVLGACHEHLHYAPLICVRSVRKREPANEKGPNHPREVQARREYHSPSTFENARFTSADSLGASMLS